MDEETDEKHPSPAPKSFTAAERIAELNDIDKSVVSLLSSASQATHVLANTSSDSSTTLESQQAAFQAHASAYFSTLSSIDVRLRRQVYALEEAGLIDAGDERDAKRGRALGAEDNPKATGGGPLDTSWLNARAGDSTEKAMDRELWAQARAFVKKLHAEEALSIHSNAGAPADSPSGTLEETGKG